ncbi:MAG: DUF4340 domain-containing protein [Verrucomicrobiota bacterium]
MNRKQLVILLVLVVVVGGAGIVVYKGQKEARSAGNSGIGKKLMSDLPVNDVTQVSIQHGAQAVNLVKKEETWRVAERNDYPANFSQISDFLIKARDLKAVQNEQVGASQLARLELAPGQGSNAPTVVEFKGNGKTLGTLSLGKMHMTSGRSPSPMSDEDGGWPDGRYVKVGTEGTEVAVVSTPFENIAPKPEQWLSKDFFKVEKPRAIEVAFPTATNSWKMTRESESGDWKLADAKAGEELDSAKTSSLSSLLSSPSFNDVLPGDKLASAGTNQPTLVKIETFDGFAYTVTVGSKTNDDYLVTVAVAAQLPKERTAGKDEKPEDKTRLDKAFKDNQQKLADKLKQEQALQNWTYMVASWVVDPVLKHRSEWLVEKKSEASTGTNSVNSAEEPKVEDPPLPAVKP